MPSSEAPPTAPANPPIFNGVFFALVPCDDIDEEKEDQIIKHLVSNGATQLALTSADLRSLTHLISTHTDFEAYNDAIEGFIHVVKPTWVYHSIQRNRVASPRQYSPDPQFFFAEVVVALAEDIPEGDRDAIMGGVIAMGGQYSNSMTKLVTHLVAHSLEPPRCRLALEKKLKCKIVIPHWFDHCLSLGKRLDDNHYTLPHPAIFQSSGGPPQQGYQEDLEGASQYEPDPLPSLSTPPDSPSRERRGLRIFKNKNIFFHPDLKLSDHLLETLTGIIIRSSGKVVSQFSVATTLICQFRGSAEFINASRQGLEVGNLNWLYYLINRNRWSAPTRRLLHYPYPEHGIKGFEKFTISVSNYQGDARVYLESLIKAAGGNFTRNMAQVNTHLITAHLSGEKCVAAVEWGVIRLNHLWIEESYAKEAVQPVTKARYTTFPDQVHLGEVVGQVEIDRMVIGELYFPKPIPQALREVEESDVEASENSDDEDLDKTTPNHSEATTPGPVPRRKRISHQTPAQRLGHGPDFEASEPRRSKNRAISKLHAMASDIALYEKETKRVGGVVYGGRRVTDPDRIQIEARSAGRRRSSFAGSGNGDEADSDGSPVPLKKQKRQDFNSSEIESLQLITILATGFKDLESVRSRLKNLNLRFVDNPFSRFDILVSPMIQRTRKFLCGLAAAPMIVRGEWLTAMGEQGRRLPPEDFLLLHDESEQVRHKSDNVDLNECLARAKTNKANRGLFRGWTIFCTANVPGGFDAFKDIVTANGGTMLLFRGRETSVTPWQAEGDERVLHMVTCSADRPLWAKFEAMAEGMGFRPQTCHSDWLCEAALTQTIPIGWKARWDAK